MWKQNPLSSGVVAILATIFGLGNLLRAFEFFRPDTVLYAVIWFAATLFTGKRTLWAPILLAILAGLHFIDDIVLEIPHFQQSVHQFSRVYGAPTSIAITLALAMALESILLGCFIYYGTSIYLRFRAEHQHPTSKPHQYPKAAAGALVKRWELRHSWAFFKIFYTMSLNWPVGLLEEEYYIKKGNI